MNNSTDTALVRAAQALCARAAGGEWDAQGEEIRADYINDARAAISELFLPDRKVTAAGILASPAVSIDRPDGSWAMQHTLSSDMIYSIWSAMLSEILRDTDDK